MAKTKIEKAVKLSISYLIHDEAGFDRETKEIVIKTTMSEIAKKFGLEDPEHVDSMSVDIEQAEMVALD